ncbi:MAG TPA: family 10 glycosylhydrolase [Chitinophagaceae bacterium]|nr:family 10 glycosylhydrolase [Chitinophagaceae bacterium]
MIKKIFPFLIVFSATCLFNSCTSSKTATEITQENTPKAMREFRAAWVATVANINWPSKPGLSTEQQQKEAITLLDFLQQHNFNAVILQVRPHADALYKSNIEPWSYYLTGKGGKAPDPYYDPLTFWIEEAHDRGMELHVWLNPYRAHHPKGDSIISDQSIIKTNPEMVVYLKQGYWWMDPAQKKVQDRTTNVVMDLVSRYDIDGVHFDDYFYPYPDYNLMADFPDSVSWTAYQNTGGKLSRGDWRRKSVNDLIERIYKEMKAAKPQVKFGISPFGLWRPGSPESACCFDQYNVLYADAKLWLNKGWIDYFTPQLYWPTKRIPLSFPVLLGWWQQENTMQRHLWPGINVGRDTGRTTVDETINQIMIARGMMPKSKGVVHWSISSDVLNTNLRTALLTGPYKDGALVPASPWLDKVAPDAPTVSVTKQLDKVQINWTYNNYADIFRWVVYYKYGNAWIYKILNRKDRMFSVKLIGGTDKAPLTLNRIAVSAVDQTGNESILREVEVK